MKDLTVLYSQGASFGGSLGVLFTLQTQLPFSAHLRIILSMSLPLPAVGKSSDRLREDPGYFKRFLRSLSVFPDNSESNFSALDDRNFFNFRL